MRSRSSRPNTNLAGKGGGAGAANQGFRVTGGKHDVAVSGDGGVVRNPGSGEIVLGWNFWDRDKWNDYLGLWGQEGFNAMVWYGRHELPAGHPTHVLLRLQEFPETRELSQEDNEKYIAQMQWLMGRAKKGGLSNYLYTHAIVFTRAFAEAHGIADTQMPVSLTVHIAHTHTINCGVRNELTRRYMEAAFVEFAQVYQDLNGFLACMSENVPGKNSSYFPQAVVSAMKRMHSSRKSGRRIPRPRISHKE